MFTLTKDMSKTIFSGSYGLVKINDSYASATKISRDPLCPTFIREFFYSNIIPFALKPTSISYSKKYHITAKYEYGGERILEYISKNNPPHQQKIQMLNQLIHKIKWLHSNDIIHADLMDGNILYDSAKKLVNIIDWGLTTFHSMEQKYEVYSMWYQAPEFTEQSSVTKSLDMWAIGCIIYFMFSANTDARRIMKHKYKIKKNGNIPQVMRFSIADPMIYTIVENLLCHSDDRWGIDMLCNHSIFPDASTITAPIKRMRFSAPKFNTLANEPEYKAAIFITFESWANYLGVDSCALSNCLNLLFTFFNCNTFKKHEILAIFLIGCMPFHNMSIMNVNIFKIFYYCDDQKKELRLLQATMEKYLIKICPEFILEPIFKTKDEIIDFWAVDMGYSQLPKVSTSPTANKPRERYQHPHKKERNKAQTPDPYNMSFWVGSFTQKNNQIPSLHTKQTCVFG
jgi:serine/threonine protein kinase